MRWLDVGREAVGVVAVGQYATGVVAIGQFAWGIVSIGQFAFGWFALGQVAVGGATVGLVGVGLHGTVAMLGVGGRGLGWVIELLPRFALPIAPDGVVELESARAHRGGGDVWVRLGLVPQPKGPVAITSGGRAVDDVRLDARVRRAAEEVGEGEVWAHLRRDPHGNLVADELIGVPPSRVWSPRWWLVWGLQLMALTLAAGGVWRVVGEPLVDGWFGEHGLFAPPGADGAGPRR